MMMTAKEEEKTSTSSGKMERRDGRRRKRKKAKCFTWISFVTCMVTMEAIAMITLLFRSHSITIVPSLEEDAMEFLVWLDTTLGGGSEQDREELAELEAHMVQLTEDRLDHGYDLEHEVETTAIDNYYSRSINHDNDNDLPTVLLVGGMKGSGTNAVADALVQLEIPMITLERSASTKDSDRKALHTGQLAWRNMINMVMSSGGIRSPNYEFSELPHLTQLRLRQEWEKFYQGFIAKFLPEQPPQKTGNSQIRFGFQAHDSLFMLPVFQEFISGPLKAIQVVRDGRDVSLLSSKLEIGFDQKQHPLQSMAERFVLETYYDTSNVTKSYDDTASFSREVQRIVETMEMWSDWNMGTHLWFRKHAADQKQQSTLDFLQLRIEDLLNPEKKFDALQELADFTGMSDKIPFKILCCMSRQAMVIEKPSMEYLKGFSKARAQHDLLQKYSAKLSFLHNEEKEDDRRKARLGDLFVDNKLGRRRQPGPSSTNNKDPDVHKEVHQQRQNRFQDIGDRLAARLSDSRPATEEGRQRRQLLEAPEKPSAKGGQSREMSKFFDLYFAWRKSLAGARNNETAATLSIEKGEKLLDEYRLHRDHLKGVLTEDSFTRSIKWLKNLHSSPKSPHGETDVPQVHDVLPHHGKWMHSLKDQPLLSEQLHVVGSSSLRAFGYVPRARFMDFDPENRKAKCHTEVTCD